MSNDLTKEKMAMKVFAMNDCDWYAARTLDEARVSYARDVCTDHYDVAADPDGIFDDPHELTDDEMDRLKHHGDEGESMEPVTFREYLAKMVADGARLPGFFASTEY